MQSMQRLVIGIFLGLGLWAIAPSLCSRIAPSTVIAYAQSYYQSNQTMGEAANLVAPDLDMEISVYPQPDTRQLRIGYGLSGDAVTVLEQTGSNEGTTWNRIQFEGRPDSEGWVQLEYLSIKSADQQSQGNQTVGKLGGYMGDRPAQQQPQPSSHQPYAQHQQSAQRQQGQYQQGQYQQDQRQQGQQ